ncbi:MAG TPA: type VI secretion system membrane subunit TssM [Bordetella sp.]|nr:type VI secretion system membrane subunit TssM [Bordetella sp.]
MINKIFAGLTFRRVAMALLVLLGIAFVVQQSPRFSYAGHAPFATPIARAWLTVALVLLWVFAYGLVALLRRLDRVRVIWEPAPPEPLPVPPDEGPLVEALDRLDGLFRSMRRVLRKGGPWWRLGRHSLYRLPWYLVLGSQGSGRSKLLSACRLDFSSPGDECEWRPGDACRFWLGERALLIEAGGMPASADTPANIEAVLWQRLRKQLRQARRGCPVDGVIVAVSVADLLGSEEGALARARDIRTRLRDVQRSFAHPYPVYVVITQCDRLAGFDAFFAHLERAAAEQVWGVTFTGSMGRVGDSPLASFSTEFAALVRSLQNRVIPLSAAADGAQAGAIYGFPTQFEAVGEPLLSLLTHVFTRSLHAPAPWLRGVYFTSGVQKGEELPVSSSPVAAAVRSAAAPPLRHAAHSQCYFITGLLRDVIFRECGLAGKAAAFMRRPASRYVVPAAIATMIVMAGAALVAGYQRNLAMMDAVQADTARLSALAAGLDAGGSEDNAAGIVALLNLAARPAIAPASSFAEAALLRRTGLYQGDRLEPVAHARYRALLRQTLLPFVQARALQAMTDPSLGDMSRFRALRAYLMLGDREHYNAATVMAWLTLDVRDLTPVAALRADMLAHARALFDGPGFEADVPLDAVVVARVRADLAPRPLVTRLADTLRSDLSAAVPSELSVAQLEGVDAPLVLHRISGRSLSEGVPGMYTLAGYRAYPAIRDRLVGAIERDGWVLGTAVSGTEAGRLRDALDRDYFSHYIAAWDTLLTDVRVGAMPIAARDAAAQMHLLAGADSPLRIFLRGVAAQTTLAGKTGGATPVDRHFANLHQLFLAQAGAAAPIAGIQDRIEGAAQFLDAVDAARQHGMPVPSADAIARLQDSAEGQPLPLGDMIRQLANDGKAVALDDVRRRIDELWRTDVAPFCHAAVDGRYPIDPRSRQDMTQDDFNRLFGPAGLLNTFFHANLLTYVDMSDSPWRWRPSAVRLGFSRAALQVFEDAATIRQAFFSDDGKTMMVHFQLTPRFLDPYFTRFDLSLGTQTLSYAHGPAMPMSFAWPDSAAAQSGRISYEPGTSDGRGGQSVSGPWALFRLLDMGTLRQVRSDRFNLDFDLSGKRVSLVLDAGSVINPFGLAALQRFHCMDRLALAGGPAQSPVRGPSTAPMRGNAG